MPRISLPARKRCVLHDTTHYDGVARDREWLGMCQAGAVNLTPETIAQIDNPVGAKIRIQLASASIHRDKQQVVSRNENTGIATPLIFPVRYSPMLPPHIGWPF